METKVVTMRLPVDVLEVYQDLADLTGVSLPEAVRETLHDAAPTVRELVRVGRLAKGGDTVGFFDALRGLAEAHQDGLGKVAGNAAEAGNEIKVKRVRSKRRVEVES